MHVCVSGDRTIQLYVVAKSEHEYMFLSVHLKFDEFDKIGLSNACQ